MSSPSPYAPGRLRRFGSAIRRIDWTAVFMFIMMVMMGIGIMMVRGWNNEKARNAEAQTAKEAPGNSEGPIVVFPPLPPMPNETGTMMTDETDTEMTTVILPPAAPAPPVVVNPTPVNVTVNMPSMVAPAAAPRRRHRVIVVMQPGATAPPTVTVVKGGGTVVTQKVITSATAR